MVKLTDLSVSRRTVFKWVLRRALFIIVAVFTTAIAILARPILHLSLTAWNDRNEIKPPSPGFVDDASHLNSTPVKVQDVPDDLEEAVQLLKELLNTAQSTGKKVAIAGARHTMGGHTIYSNGISLDMSGFRHMELDSTSNILRVGAGARWEAIIPYLNERGRSVAVMQSNNDFSVGGTMSANAHGWQHNSPPFANTVDSFQLMLANGSVVRCSRQENTELFSLVLGGYGLFGIILDVDLRVVKNEMYRAQRMIVPTQQYVEIFEKKVNRAIDIGMVYGRISVAPDRFLKEAIITLYRQELSSSGLILPLSKQSPQDLTRTVLRGEVESNYGKNLRWKLEKALGGEAGSQVSRNQILNRSSRWLENRKLASTDILHEYFIPPQSLEAFLEKCRMIIPKHKGDLLNLTVRNVYRDKDSFLRYANQNLLGLVMLFHQRRTREAEAQMQAMTIALIDAALNVEGKYYLPYRLHATAQQFARAYPQADEFFSLKRQYDPKEIFQNQFYLKYGKS